MNANTVLKNYGSLTPEERFRLILAASGLGDEAERERLLKAGERLTLSMPDHSPFGHAFSEISYLTFIELIEEAASYFDAFVCMRNEPETTEDDDPAETNNDRPDWLRSLDLALAACFVLRVKYEGWKLFCERLNIPAELLWRCAAH